MPKAAHASLQSLLAALSAARALYDNAPCGLLALNAELRCVNINQTLLDIREKHAASWAAYQRELRLRAGLEEDDKDDEVAVR